MRAIFGKMITAAILALALMVLPFTIGEEIVPSRVFHDETFISKYNEIVSQYVASYPTADTLKTLLQLSHNRLNSSDTKTNYCNMDGSVHANFYNDGDLICKLEVRMAESLFAPDLSVLPGLFLCETLISFDNKLDSDALFTLVIEELSEKSLFSMNEDDILTYATEDYVGTLYGDGNGSAYFVLEPIERTTPQYEVLEIGSKGDNVTKLQMRLNELGYSVGEVDGHFGQKTKNAIIDYQHDNGLEENGIASIELQERLFDTELTSEKTVIVSEISVEQMAANCIEECKAMAKNPASLQIHGIKYFQQNDGYIFVMDMTGENSFGGADRTNFACFVNPETGTATYNSIISGINYNMYVGTKVDVTAALALVD